MLGALGLALWVPVAVGTQPVFRLDYQRDPDAPHCPDAPQLQHAVSTRLGRDPWDAASPDRFTVRIRRDGRDLAASVARVDAQGNAQGTRGLRSPDQDCEELASAVALAISIAIDPLAALAPEPPPAPPAPPPAPESPPPPAPLPELEAPAPPPALPRGAPPRPRPVPSKAWTFPAGRLPRAPAVQTFMSASGVVDGWIAPHPVAGTVLGGGVRWRDFSVAVEGRVDLLAFQDVGTGRLSTQALTLSAVPCWHQGWLLGCGVLTAGALSLASYDIQDAQQVLVPYVAAGGRVGLEVPVVPHLRLRTALDATANPWRVRLRDSLTGESFWEAPPGTAAISLGLLGIFP